MGLFVMARPSHCRALSDASQFRLPLSGRPLSGLSNMMFMASLGLIGFSFSATHEVPCGVSIGVSGIFLLLKIVDQRRENLEMSEGHGGRDRTRTCDLLRVKQAL